MYKDEPKEVQELLHRGWCIANDIAKARDPSFELNEDRQPLSEVFPLVAQPTGVLPAAFEAVHCNKPMEPMPLGASTRRRPFAVFQCVGCKAQLMLFEAPRAPLIIWSGEFRQSGGYSQFDFSELVDRAIEERERRHAAREK